jgi:hypothetical protein
MRNLFGSLPYRSDSPKAKHCGVLTELFSLPAAPERWFTSLTRSCQSGNPYSRANTSWALRCDNGSSACSS